MLFAARAIRSQRVEHGDAVHAVVTTDLRRDELLNAHPIFGVRVAVTRKHREHAVHGLARLAPTPIFGRALAVVTEAARAAGLVHAFLKRLRESGERDLVQPERAKAFVR